MDMKKILLKTGNSSAGLAQFLSQNIKNQPQVLVDSFNGNILKYRQNFLTKIKQNCKQQSLLECILAGESYCELLQVLIRKKMPFSKELKLAWLDLLRNEHSTIESWQCQELNTVLAIICLHVRWFICDIDAIAHQKIYIERIEKLLSWIAHFRKNKRFSQNFRDLAEDNFILCLKYLSQAAVHEVKSVYIQIQLAKNIVDLIKERQFIKKLPAYLLYASNMYTLALKHCIYDSDTMFPLKQFMIKKSSNLCFKAYLSYAKYLLNQIQINGDLISKEGVRLTSCMPRAEHNLAQLKKNQAFQKLTQLQIQQIQTKRQKALKDFNQLFKNKLFKQQQFTVDLSTLFIHFDLLAPVRDRPVIKEENIQNYLKSLIVKNNVQLNKLLDELNRLQIETNSIDTSLEDSSQQSSHKKEVIRQARISVKKLPIFQDKKAKINKLIQSFAEFKKRLKEIYGNLQTLYGQRWTIELNSYVKINNEQAIEALFRSFQPIAKQHLFLYQVFSDKHNLNLIEQFDLEKGSFNTVSFINIKHSKEGLADKVIALKFLIANIIKQIKNEQKLRSVSKLKFFEDQKQKIAKQLRQLKETQEKLKSSVPRLHSEKSLQIDSIAKSNLLSLTLRADLQSLLSNLKEQVIEWSRKVQGQFVMIFDQCQQLQYKFGVIDSVELPVQQLDDILQQAKKLL